jgi:hypothetical protein
MNYTKGEWKYEHEYRYHNVVAIDGNTKSTVVQCGTLENSEANAHLIAAAPEMYEALKEIKSLTEEAHTFPKGVLIQSIAAKCFLVLNKVEGK